MSATLNQIGLLLLDYYFVATCLLLCAAVVLLILRQPAARLAVAWLAITGVYFLAATVALPNSARISLLQRDPLPSGPSIIEALDSNQFPSIPAASADRFDPTVPIPRTTAVQTARKSTVPPANDNSTKATNFSPIGALVRQAIAPLPVAEIATLFAVGTGATLAWLGIGALRARRLCRRAQPAPTFVHDILARLAPNSSTVLRVVVTAEIDSAAVLGLWRPTIVLPAWIVDEPSGSSLPAALVHEYAHIQRKDLWLLAASRCLMPVLYLHPLYWWLRRTIAIDQELVADAVTAESCGRREYAENLVAWAKRLKLSKHRLAGALGIWQRPGQITRRLQTLLDERTLIQQRCTRRYRGGTAAIALILVALLSTVTIRPKSIANADPPPPATAQATQLADDSSAKPASGTPLAVSGVCLDENRKPLASARLVVFEILFRSLDDMQQRQIAEAQSNDRGEFQLSVPNLESVAGHPPHLRVFAQAPGRATSAEEIARDKGAQKPLEFVLPPAASLRGRITDSEGRPISGATVSAGCGLIVPVPGIGCAVSDADGRYEIADLRPWDVAAQKPRPVPGNPGLSMFAGSCTALVQHPDFARQPMQYSKVPDAVDVVLQKPAVIAGRVLLSENDRPAAGVRLEFSSDTIGPDSWTRATTDERGEYKLATLPPGKYELRAKLEGRPVLWKYNVALQSGPNALDLRMDRGGIIRGRVIDVTTKQPITGEQMDISRNRRYQGAWWGMDGVVVAADGTFTLLVPAGRTHLSMYRGPKWDSVNTDRLLEEGVEVAEGQTVDVEIRLRPKDNRVPQEPTPEDLQLRSEQAAVAAIKSLGGWVESEKIDGRDHVVAVNMVYHQSDDEGRLENHFMTDEALFYVRKFPLLRELYLTSTQATDAALTNLRGMENLETVMIWDASAVTDVGVIPLAALPGLKSVHISNAQLTDEALRLLGQAPRIESISLQGNHFTDKGLEYLRGKTGLTGLDVGLGKCEITDDGLKQIEGLTNLIRLDLQRSKVTNAGLKHLRGMKDLVDLWAGETAVTRDGILELRKNLPKLKGTYNDWQPRDDYPEEE